MPNTRRIRQFLAFVIVASSTAILTVVMFRQLRFSSSEITSRTTSHEIDMSLAKLNFSEMRGNDKLWDLTAERADYDKKTGKAVLTGVKAEIFAGKVGGLVISAGKGNYFEEQHLVRMQNNVQAVTKKGMTLVTDWLEYRSVPGLVTTDRPVTIRDGRLTLKASGMELYVNDEKVLFHGPVDAVIEGYHAKR